MKRETRIIDTVCDCCGDVKVQPSAVAGLGYDGWETFYKLDLCPICYGLIANRLITTVGDKVIEETIEEVKEQRENRRGPTILC